MANDLKVNRQNLDDIAHVRRELSNLLLRMQQRRPLETGIYVFALAQVLTEMLDKYPPSTRAGLCEAITPYIEHAPVALEGDSPLVLLTKH